MLWVIKNIVMVQIKRLEIYQIKNNYLNYRENKRYSDQIPLQRLNRYNLIRMFHFVNDISKKYFIISIIPIFTRSQYGNTC